MNCDVIVLLFATDRLDTLRRVHSYWLPELQRLNVVVPIILVGCKNDISTDNFKEVNALATGLKVLRHRLLDFHFPRHA